MTVADLQRQRGRDELVCRGERGKRTGIENNIACATPQLPLTFLATPLLPLPMMPSSSRSPRLMSLVLAGV